MKLLYLMISFLFMFTIFGTDVQVASAREKTGMSGYKYKEVRDSGKVKKDKEKEKKEAEKKAEENKDNAILTTKDVLMSMLQFENRQGLLDYKVDVMEVTQDPLSNRTKSVQKEIYFLAPARILILQDSFPVSYIDDYLFEKRMRDYNTELMPEEAIENTPCYVIKTWPIEKVFEKNVKFYYIAKDNFRKIRIESTHFNVSGESLTSVTDFFYIGVNNMYTLPLRSESRTYENRKLPNETRQLLKETITATFMNWKFNIGLTPEFFTEKLKNSQLYDVVK